MSKILAIAAAFTLLAGLTACGGSSSSSGDTNPGSDVVTTGDAQTNDGTEGGDTTQSADLDHDFAGLTPIQSGLTRETAPQVPPSDLETLAADNNRFAWKLYQQLRTEDGNLFFSPYSMTLALAMTYAGAKSTTATEMETALEFSLGQSKLHTTLNALDLELAKRGVGAQGADGGKFRLNIVNAIWGRTGYTFLDPFLDTLALNYGAGLFSLDFVGDPDGSRLLINDWVATKTEERIKDLLPGGSVTSDTVLVLTNAIYFNAAWYSPFDEKDTDSDGVFTLLDSTTVKAVMMKQIAELEYKAGDGYQVVQMPYSAGENKAPELSMYLILPDSGTFASFEGGLDSEAIEGIIGGLGTRQVTLTLPRFEFTAQFEASLLLGALGMPTAFTDLADFSGMNGIGGLVISKVIHKAFVKVNEQGTEAAAATAVIINDTSVPEPATITLDRPFLFLIRD
ncbi:MAG: serpin family protein, partial [Myxococcales bacterium]|nr:serpin family protein [Myxococcales bacterium]